MTELDTHIQAVRERVRQQAGEVYQSEGAEEEYYLTCMFPPNHLGAWCGITIAH